MIDANNEIIEHMNFKTNYSLMKNVYQSNFSQTNFPQTSFPPGFSNPTKKPQLSYLLLHYLIISIPLQKPMFLIINIEI